MKIENLDFFENPFSLVFIWKISRFLLNFCSQNFQLWNVLTFDSIKYNDFGKKQKPRAAMKLFFKNRNIWGNAMRGRYSNYVTLA